MGTDDKKAMVIKFNTAYYLAKNERPLSDYLELLELQEKNGVRDIGKVYLTDKKCPEFTKYIAHVVRKAYRKTGTRDTNGTLKKPENRNPGT